MTVTRGSPPLSLPVSSSRTVSQPKRYSAPRAAPLKLSSAPASWIHAVNQPSTHFAGTSSAGILTPPASSPCPPATGDASLDGYFDDEPSPGSPDTPPFSLPHPPAPVPAPAPAPVLTMPLPSSQPCPFDDHGVLSTASMKTESLNMAQMYPGPQHHPPHPWPSHCSATYHEHTMPGSAGVPGPSCSDVTSDVPHPFPCPDTTTDAPVTFRDAPPGMAANTIHLPLGVTTSMDTAHQDPATSVLSGLSAGASFDVGYSCEPLVPRCGSHSPPDKPGCAMLCLMQALDASAAVLTASPTTVNPAPCLSVKPDSSKWVADLVAPPVLGQDPAPTVPPINLAAPVAALVAVHEPLGAMGASSSGIHNVICRVNSVDLPGPRHSPNEDAPPEPVPYSASPLPRPPGPLQLPIAPPSLPTGVSPGIQLPVSGSAAAGPARPTVDSFATLGQHHSISWSMSPLPRPPPAAHHERQTGANSTECGPTLQTVDSPGQAFSDPRASSNNLTALACIAPDSSCAPSPPTSTSVSPTVSCNQTTSCQPEADESPSTLLSEVRGPVSDRCNGSVVTRQSSQEVAVPFTPPSRLFGPAGKGRALSAPAVLKCLDCHAGGEPARVVLAGHPALPDVCNTAALKRSYMMEHLDHLRKVMLFEPRGYPCQNVDFIFPPDGDSPHLQYVIGEQNFIYPLMSGHNTICVATALLESGAVAMQEPVTEFTLEAPVGPIRIQARCAGGRAETIILRNAPCFVGKLGAVVDVPHGIGKVTVDIAFGGMWYAVVDLAQFTQDPGLRPDTWSAMLDRSPCGTGTCAVMAVMHARGQLKVGQPFKHESIVGSCFVGTILEESHVTPLAPDGQNYDKDPRIQFLGCLETGLCLGPGLIKLPGDGRPAIIPQIEGSACITQYSDVVVDVQDPFPKGYTVADIWSGGSCEDPSRDSTMAQ
eukprot:gene1952-470_t